MTPSTIAIFPLPDVILFPGTFLPLHIFEPRYRSMISYCSESGNDIAIAAFKIGIDWRKSKNPDIEEIFGWGKIVQRNDLPDGRSNILVEGKGIVKLQNYREFEPFRIGNVFEYPYYKDFADENENKEQILEILHLTKRILLADGAPEDFLIKINHLMNHPHPFDFVSSILNFPINLKQELLEIQSEVKKARILKGIIENINLRE
ncbi:LON peptidase substrate-binding domain-containing protein [Leptospira sp. GIMC2001]|uniref:LON peptidase substrate-binding domain-containing protein n=1 Tax=Leptospira sp. GIMC2001 TaxID=1513297 RepID=UPI00234A41B0|nr:LON peptidase substrate-binding domain-containing protein [Leptospira sp. GIMC2001]WCL47903.1 LON peptidase substrate-binding domain-containing protein [Leptospira sp. GIMC2001]